MSNSYVKRDTITFLDQSGTGGNRQSLSLQCANGCGVLVPWTLFGVSFWRCRTCAGIFLDRANVGTLRRLPKEVASHTDQAVLPSSPGAAAAGHRRVDPKPCPHCRSLMQPYVVAGRVPVVLDHCGTCEGIWADDGELVAVTYPEDFESEVHFNSRNSTTFRNDVISNLYEVDEKPVAPNVVEEALVGKVYTLLHTVRHSKRE
ncbi:MAG: zf-TFIIB domain-containing protein [Capsulimonadaceae bacterium]